MRRIVGPDMAVVTPGIRPPAAAGDQKRVMTPADAIRAGASHLVVADRSCRRMTRRPPPAHSGRNEDSLRQRNREEKNMAKGYWIARVDVRDPERYKDYVATAKPAFEEFGANFLARGGAYEAMEGKGRARNVVIEFPSLQAARTATIRPNTRRPRRSA